MKIGDNIHVRAQKVRNGSTVQSGIEVIPCKVYQIHNGYAVLDLGLYKTCAYLSDIKSKNVISI